MEPHRDLGTSLGQQPSTAICRTGSKGVGRENRVNTLSEHALQAHGTLTSTPSPPTTCAASAGALSHRLGPGKVRNLAWVPQRSGAPSGSEPMLEEAAGWAEQGFGCQGPTAPSEDPWTDTAPEL